MGNMSYKTYILDICPDCGDSLILDTCHQCKVVWGFNKIETKISELIPKLYNIGVNIAIIQEYLNEININIKQEDNKDGIE